MHVCRICCCGDPICAPIPLATTDCIPHILPMANTVHIAMR